MTQAYFPKHTVFLFPTDPDSAKPAAGVGLLAAQGIRCTNLIAQTEKLAFFRQQGRAGSSTALMVINLYGWQGAANNSNSRKRTDKLIEALQEFDTTGIGPKVKLGDFNTDIDSSPAMRKLLTQQGWTDVASFPAPINSQQFQPTCTGYGAKKATRRDFVLANDVAVLAITSCSVNTQVSFDVHSPITIQVCARNFSPTVLVARKPRRFDWQRLRQMCMQRIDEEKQSSSNFDGAMNYKNPTSEEIKIYEQHRLENSFRRHFSKIESQLEEALARAALF